MNDNLILDRQPKNYWIIKIVETIICVVFTSLFLYFIYKLDVGASIMLLVGIEIAIFLILFLIYYMSYITHGFHLGENNLAVAGGVFSKKISIIKYKKIQYINIRQSPISSKLNLCNADIYILASLGNDMRILGYYNKSIFENLKNKILK